MHTNVVLAGGHADGVVGSVAGHRAGCRRSSRDKVNPSQPVNWP